ncbi:hypothetical protein EYR41_002473 [Orbilia oligospora]|uniref:Uncharacterized protein n=1 Tax=Orbilia oligospora TaxID=2813651 RepID=A0A7C8P6N8_ORBOL|nr:hypothetical protein TWF751_002484 [Orbilia oligospora]KAF3282171.1 hypothetical protein TWF132_010751 [Orbilia oligospora]TGJ62498.1 hypothetical protein EYR41_002473 [Orbilia oligospora]
MFERNTTNIHETHGLHGYFIAPWLRGYTHALFNLVVVKFELVIGVDIKYKMIPLLFVSLFGTITSAFYVEVVPVSFPDLGPWQLCHSTRPAQGKYELTLWAIDIVSTSCEATKGDPHFQLLEDVDPDLGRYALGGDKPKARDEHEEEIKNRGLKPMIMTEKNLNVALTYRVRAVGGDIIASFEPRRYGSEMPEEPVIGDVLKFVGGSNGLLNQNELGLQIDLVQTDAGDVYAGKENAGRKSIFRSESNPSPDANSPEVIFRISSPQRIYELNREILTAQKKPKKGFAPKEAVKNFFGGITKSISNKVSNAKETVKYGLERGLASVMGGDRMHIHGLEESFEEEKEQDGGRKGDLEDRITWQDRFGNDQDDNWERRLARFYGEGSNAGNVPQLYDNGEEKEMKDSLEDIEEGGEYYGEGRIIDAGIIQGNYIDEMKVEEKPKSMEIFEVEQGKPSPKLGSRNQV